MKEHYLNKCTKKIQKELISVWLLFFILLQSQAFSSDEEFLNAVNIKVPKEVLNYANRHNLQVEVEKYNIEKTDVKNGNKYKCIYPCVNKRGKVFAILYKNAFYIKTAKPKAYDQLYLGTR